MNSLLSCDICKDKSKTLILHTMLLFCSLPIFLNSVCLVPLYASIQSNVIFESSILGIMVKYLQDILDLTAFSVSYALIIFSALLICKKQSRLGILIYTVSFALRIPISLIMNMFLYGSFGTSAEITIDLIYLFAYFLLEMIQLLIVYIFAVTDSRKYLMHIEIVNTKKKKRQKNAENTEKKYVLPFSKFFDWYNPLQRSAIKMSLMICFMKIASRLVNDIVYGAPQSFGEVIIMILYYTSDILYGAVAYIIALITFNAVYEKLKIDGKKTDEETSPSVLQ